MFPLYTDGNYYRNRFLISLSITHQNMEKEEEESLLLDDIMNDGHEELDLSFIREDNHDEEKDRYSEKNQTTPRGIYHWWKTFQSVVLLKRGKIFILLSAIFLAIADTLAVIVINESSNPFGVSLITKTIVLFSSTIRLAIDRTPLSEIFKTEPLLLFFRGVLGGSAITLQLIAYDFVNFAVETTIKSTLIFISGISGWIILNERMTCADIVMATFCVIGIATIANPFGILTSHQSVEMQGNRGLFTIGILISIGDAICCGVAVALSRLLNLRGVATHVIIFFGVLYSLPIDIVCITLSQQPDLSFTKVEWLFLLTCGIFRYTAFFFSTLACFYEKSTISSLVFAASAVIEYPIQTVLFNKVPTLNTIVGSFFIIPCIITAFILKSDDKISG